MKKSLLALGAATVVGVSTLGAGVASAHSGNSEVKMDLASKIAAKFNLDKNEVQKVFDEAHAEHKVIHEQKLQERLDQAVKDGKLTQTQADQLQAKLQELRSVKISQGDDDKTMKEHHAAMKAKFEELKQWAKDQDIPEDFLPMMGPKIHHKVTMEVAAP